MSNQRRHPNHAAPRNGANSRNGNRARNGNKITNGNRPYNGNRPPNGSRPHNGNNGNRHPNGGRPRNGNGTRNGRGDTHDFPTMSETAAFSSSAVPVWKKAGLIVSGVQLLISLILILLIVNLNVLPTGLFMVVFSIIFLLWALPFVAIITSRKKGKAIVGKVVSVMAILVLLYGINLVWQGTQAMDEVAGEDFIVTFENIVVAVLVDDQAQSIQDAAEYTFGVQFATGGDSIRSMIESLNEELESPIWTSEFNSILEQGEALIDGQVRAIIYNQAFNGVLEERIPGFTSSIRVLGSKQIATETVNVAADIEMGADPFVVYISGLDEFGPIETSGLSDVNILMVVNPSTHQILLVNTPRDYYIPFPGVSGGARDKLTHAGVFGVGTSMAALAELYQVDVPFYVKVNFTSMVQIVDAMGGIEVYSEQSFVRGDLFVSHGWNFFNGAQALTFSREREFVEGGDFQRGRNQQAVIMGMMRRAMSPAILTSANEILASVSGSMSTSMTTTQIQDVIRNQLDGNPSWNVKSVAAEGWIDYRSGFTMPGEPLSMVIPYDDSVARIREQIAAVMAGEILPGGEALE